MIEKINNKNSSSFEYKQKKTNKNSFINELKQPDEKNIYEANLDFQNIKKIPLEEINTIFLDKEQQQIAKNLKLSTLFTQDESLQKALFNTVLGQPFDVGFSFLSNRYNDKSIFLNNKEDTLSSLLHESMLYKNKEVPQEKLDEILLKVKSLSFLDSLFKTSKDQYNKYKDDKKSDYSFLYNDYALQYESLITKYKNIENSNNNILKQY